MSLLFAVAHLERDHGFGRVHVALRAFGVIVAAPVHCFFPVINNGAVPSARVCPFRDDAGERVEAVGQRRRPGLQDQR